MTTTAVTDLFARRATLARSGRLLGAFRYEQSDPDRFYSTLAADTESMVADLWKAGHPSGNRGCTVLDVGGGPGYFARAFTQAGWNYVGVEPDPAEMHAANAVRGGPGNFVRASGMALPFADRSVDVCLSSNVAEHIARPWQLGSEMLRVIRPGGLAVLSYPSGWGPSVVTRPDCGTTSEVPARRRATPAATAVRQKTTTGRRCSAFPPPTDWTGPPPPAP